MYDRRELAETALRAVSMMLELDRRSFNDSDLEVLEETLVVGPDLITPTDFKLETIKVFGPQGEVGLTQHELFYVGIRLNSGEVGVEATVEIRGHPSRPGDYSKVIARICVGATYLTPRTMLVREMKLIVLDYSPLSARDNDRKRFGDIKLPDILRLEL